MPKVITQETFDDVVKENVVEFDMSPDEAKLETVQQFMAQGISLSNIIQDLSINAETGRPLLNEVCERINTYIGEKSTDRSQLLADLSILEKECLKSLAHRVLAGKNSAHDALITLLEQQCNTEEVTKQDKDVIIKCLKALNALSLKQPDLFSAEALVVAIKLLSLKEGEEITCLVLQWLQKVTVMHELNRQNIINGGLLNQLKPFVTKDNLSVLRDVLTLIRNLVLDDDIRVEFGCAHEHARQIANQFIVDLTKLMAEINDVDVLSDLILTISALAVRQEFCKSIEEAGGLKYVFDLVQSNPDEVRLHREAFKFLRALAGHDAVKLKIAEQGVAPIAKEILDRHMNVENLATVVLAFISTLTLRVKANSDAIFDTGIAETIVETLRTHPQSKIVQRNGAWAIRNMVSRSRDQCETWLSHGVEDLLNEAMRTHPSVEQDIKAALRDLGCKVTLKEEWTGTAEKKIINKN